MKLRPASLSDAQQLLDWRNDSATRRASLSTEHIEPAPHERWLRETLNNTSRKLFVVEHEGRDVGTVRVDSYTTHRALSWAVAPQERGSGLGKRMVAELVERLRADAAGTLRAEIRADNLASIQIAVSVGMRPVHEALGVCTYELAL